MEYIAFFAAITHNQIDFVIEVMTSYEIGAYLIGLETTTDSHKESNGEHIHFLVQMNDKDYHKFSKRLFIEKYKLRGRALKDQPRQYGKVNQINDITRMAAYTLKDGNIRSNMTEEQLADYKQITFKKTEKDDFRKELMAFIKKDLGVLLCHYDCPRDPTFIEIVQSIIKYYRSLSNKLTLSKSQIEQHTRYYQLYHTTLSDLALANQYFPHN